MAKLLKSIKSRFTKKVWCDEPERSAKIVVMGPRDVARAAIVATFLKRTEVGRDIMHHLLETETGNLHVKLVDSNAVCSSFLNRTIASAEIFILLSDKDVPSSKNKVQQLEAVIRENKVGIPHRIYTALAESTELPNYNFPIMDGMNIGRTQRWRTIIIHATSPDYSIIQSFLIEINSYLESRVSLLSG